ncbi:MAG: UDP-N-acetylmuramoyl-L-alanine--D-glutamate ligase, partial [Proteobacteria bacterium]|nr:UDP-N-acetylmuramoyl-L-alanine--D-glutamate ligase [Pseudomonadota bacterium]
MSPASNSYAGLRVAVLGLGRSGLAAARLLSRCGASVTALDSGESPLLVERAVLLKGEGIAVVTGGDAAKETSSHDL